MTSPVLPMNRYKYGFGNRSVKAVSSLSKRIVLNPERQEKASRLAALYRIVKGE